jgi:F420-non-reducing hydrogenase iron-sulfur subunit
MSDSSEGRGKATAEAGADAGKDRQWSPRIVGFLCNWCSYTGADLAGVSRLQYTPEFIPIRVMCSGSVDVAYIIKALLEGADGVLIGGCHLGDCHYLNGNYKARRRVAVMKEVMEGIGIDPRRLRLEWISASEAGKFARTVTAFEDELRQLGPNPLAGQRLI